MWPFLPQLLLKFFLKNIIKLHKSHVSLSGFLDCKQFFSRQALMCTHTHLSVSYW